MADKVFFVKRHLKPRRWFRRLCCIFKITKNEAPSSLISLIPKREQIFNTRNKHLPTYYCRADCFRCSLFPCTLNDWFNLHLRNPESITIYKSKLLSFICPVHNRFRYNFQEWMHPVCSCSLEIEATSHYLLHCYHFTLHRNDLMKNAKSICNNFESMSNTNKITLLLCGDSRFDENKNKFILQSSINYVKIFSGSLFE